MALEKPEYLINLIKCWFGPTLTTAGRQGATFGDLSDNLSLFESLINVNYFMKPNSQICMLHHQKEPVPGSQV